MNRLVRAIKICGEQRERVDAKFTIDCCGDDASMIRALLEMEASFQTLEPEALSLGESIRRSSNCAFGGPGVVLNFFLVGGPDLAFRTQKESKTL